MKHIVLAAIAASALLATTAQPQPVCLTLPADSPVLSSSPDDIPSTGIDIVTYTGALAKARANHTVAFVQMNANEQRVWFAVDTSEFIPYVFYNRRYRANSSSPWYWQYSASPAVIQTSPTGGGPNAVLYSATAKYRDPSTGTLYKYIMWETAQPGACNGIIAGFLYYSLSNDGICWTPPTRVSHSGGPSFDCLPGVTDTVPIEGMTAIDGGDYMYLVGVEGNIVELSPPPTETRTVGDPPVTTLTMRHWSNPDSTLTVLGFTQYSDPGTLLLPSSTPILSNYGIYNFAARWGNYTNGTRYTSYSYFINPQMAYDTASGNLYISRGYPYPYDRGSFYLADSSNTWDVPWDYNTPLYSQLTATFLMGPGGNSFVEGCLNSPYTLPNRIQIYKMHIGTLSLTNMLAVTSGTWTLVGDYGGSAGYGFNSGPSTSSTALTSPQTNAGRDYGAANFIVDSTGSIVRDGSGQVQVLGADTYKLSKSVGPCRITGLERETLLTVP